MGFDGLAPIAEDEPTVKSISVKTNPTKTTYTHGDSIDLTGGVITVTYEDDTTKEVDMTDPKVSISTGNLADAKVPQVTISYGGKEASFPITVSDPVQLLTVKTPMSKVEYDHGKNFDFSTLQLEATKKSGAKETLTSASAGVTISETAANIASSHFTQLSAEGVVPPSGMQEIIFTYEGKTAKQTVTVNDTISSIAVQNQPTKVIYKRGESLNLSRSKSKSKLAEVETILIYLFQMEVLRYRDMMRQV